MKKILFLSMFLFSLISCDNDEKTRIEHEQHKYEQFIVIHQYANYAIVYDKDTFVEYIVTHVHYGNTFTLLVNSDGTPKIYKDNSTSINE